MGRAGQPVEIAGHLHLSVKTVEGHTEMDAIIAYLQHLGTDLGPGG